VLAVLATAALPGSVPAQTEEPPELVVHRLIKPKSMEDFLERGERAVVSCDRDCNVVMRLVASRRIARRLGHPNSRVFARGSAPIIAGFRGKVAARPRGIAAKRLRNGVLAGGFSFKIRLKAHTIS
jgi:hypothetical protein